MRDASGCRDGADQRETTKGEGVTKKKKKKTTKPGKKPECMNPRCTSRGRGRYAVSRGLCKSCYAALLYRIANESDSEVTSWEQAASMGWCNPSTGRGRRCERFPVKGA